MRTLLTATALLLGLPAVRAEDSWTQFRGPNGSGVSRSAGLPTTWDEKTHVAWKTAVPGKGWSSPVVLGKQVWLTTAPPDGTTRSALCFDRDTGKLLHDVKVFDTPKPLYTFHAFNSHASPTPVIEPGRVYVHFGAAGTACLDTQTAKVLWKRTDFSCNHWRGPGSSPVLAGDKLMLTFDGYDKQYLVALNKGDGTTAWRKDRAIRYRSDNGDLKKAYGTPAVFVVGGKAQLVSPSAGAVIAYDPETGNELWRVRHPGMNAATPPLLADGLVLVTTGDPSRLLAVRPTGEGDVTATHVAWTCKSGVPNRPAPLVVGDLLYMVNNGGTVTCLEVKTGETVWSKRYTGNYTASPVFADGRLYLFDQDGKARVLRVGRAPQLEATNTLADGCMASPAVAGKALFVRTKTHLYRIEQK
jgi:outer membrane protein assembly factor BamB